MNNTFGRPRNFLWLPAALVAAILLSVLGGLGMRAYGGYRVVQAGEPIADRMHEVGAKFLVLEEVMTMSARMTAESGNGDWEERYRRAEPKLDHFIDEARRLQPDARAGTAAARIDSANNALVAMQHRAFDLVRQGNKEEAQRVLSSRQHELQRERYAEGMSEFNAGLVVAEDSLQAKLVESKRIDAIRTSLSLVLLVLGALFVFRSTRRWHAISEESNRQLSKRAVDLQEFNTQLDLRVGERTRELTDSAIASLNMMEDVVRERASAEQAHKDLDYLASYDPLTGLANRALFLERVQARLLQTGGATTQAVFKLDIQRFRSVNDAFGHNAGDDLLRQVAQRLVQVGGGDASRFARIDADRFAIVSDVDSAAQAGRYVEQRLDAIFRPPFRIGANNLRVSVKAGIALFPDDGVDADSLLRNAEAALKKAQGSGEQFLFFTEAMTERVAERLSLEHRLRQAIDNEEFVLHYQPKLSGTTGMLVGVEALIRWNDPKSGLVPPGLFIPILEDTGLIGEVGRWAMRKAVSDYLRWCDAGLPVVRIAVNVSALQLRHRDFVTEVRHAIGFDARAAAGLELEITESMIMDDMKQAIVTLQAIRDLGVSIAIDDFGTGFSSLGYLSKLPIDTLKIDRSFVTGMTVDEQGMSLVSTIIQLAHSMRLKVVAEGVETEEQARLLRLLRCDELQGYLYSKPLPGEVFEVRYLTSSLPAAA